jgi:hypothetical protein
VTGKHSLFLKTEFGVDDVMALDDGAFGELYDKLCDIEIKEVLNAERERRDVSERGNIAADIVTFMAEQFEDDDDEFDDEELDDDEAAVA